jgi:hypothetical protein
VEEFEGFKFAVKEKLYDKYGPFNITSIKGGSRVFLQTDSAKNSGAGCC